MKPQQRSFDADTLAAIKDWLNPDDMRELSADMREIVNLLTEHVDDGTGKPVCGASDFEPDLLVIPTLASDCPRCHTARMIDDEKGQRPVATWEPQPMEGADTMLDEKQKRSDGQ